MKNQYDFRREIDSKTRMCGYLFFLFLGYLIYVILSSDDLTYYIYAISISVISLLLFYLHLRGNTSQLKVSDYGVQFFLEDINNDVFLKKKKVVALKFDEIESISLEEERDLLFETKRGPLRVSIHNFKERKTKRIVKPKELLNLLKGLSEGKLTEINLEDRKLISIRDIHIRDLPKHPHFPFYYFILTCFFVWFTFDYFYYGSYGCLYNYKSGLENICGIAGMAFYGSFSFLFALGSLGMLKRLEKN